MALRDQIALINFGSISSAGRGARELGLDRSQLGPALGEALTLSPTRAQRLARGVIDTAGGVDEAAQDVDAMVAWAARQGTQERQIVADATRLSGGELLLVDRIARLPRTEARPFLSEWLHDGGNRRAVATWLATVGAVLRRHGSSRPGHSGGVVDWIEEAAEDVVDAVQEAVETIVDAVVEAGQSIADLVSDIADWTIDQVGDLVQALLEAGMTLAELVDEAVTAGATLLKKVVKAMIEIGQTVADVLREVAAHTVAAMASTVRALREIGRTVAGILQAAVEVAGEALRRVVQALAEIGRSVVQIIGDALEAAFTVAVAVVRTLLDLGRTVATLITDVVTGRRSLLDALVEALREVGRSVGDLLTEAGRAVAGALRSVTASLARIGAAVLELASWAADAATRLAREVIAGLVDIGTSVLDLVTAVAAAGLAVMRTVVDGLYAVGRTFAGLLQDLAGAAKDLLSAFLRAAFQLGATIVEFVAATVRRTYRAAKELIEAALEAGARAADLLAEAARGSYYLLRRVVVGVLDTVGLGEVCDWALRRLEEGIENAFHEVLTALRYAGARLQDSLDWALATGQQAFDAVMEAWESVRESLEDLYAWASAAGQQAWEWIARTTVRLRNSVVYALTYLERDFIPGVRRFVRGLLQAGYELAWLAVRVVRRSLQLLVEVVREVVATGGRVALLLLAAAADPQASLDHVVAALRAAEQGWRDIMAAVDDAGEDLAAEVAATMERLEEPLQDMLHGALEVSGGLLGLLVMELMNLLGSYRPLTEAEKQQARLVFADSVDLDAVAVSEESLDNRIIFGVQAFFQELGDGAASARAFVTGTLINFKADEPMTLPTLIHELTHVWQHLVTGPMYLVEAIHAQVAGDGYNYGYTNATNGDGGDDDLEVADGDFESFNREQQGQIAMHYYVRRYVEGRGEPEWEDWWPYVEHIQEAA